MTLREQFEKETGFQFFDCPANRKTTWFKYSKWLEAKLEGAKDILEKIYEESSTNTGEMTKNTAMRMFKYFNPEGGKS